MSYVTSHFSKPPCHRSSHKMCVPLVSDVTYGQPLT